MPADFLPGFSRHFVETAPGITLHARSAGRGPAVLLLHGHPQTLSTWYKVAPALAERFTVVAADLRGDGDSAKPPSTPDHAPYAKRAMAEDPGPADARWVISASPWSGTIAAAAWRTGWRSTMRTPCGASPCSVSRRRWRCTSAPTGPSPRAMSGGSS